MSRFHVLVNAGNVTARGPRALVLSLLPALVEHTSQISFTLLLPDEEDYRKLSLPSNAAALFTASARGVNNDLQRLKQLNWDIPRLARRVRADVCLTLGDLAPLDVGCPQVVFLHTPYLVYTQQELRGASWPLLKRLYLTRHFAATARRAAAIVVQTPVMAERLARRYAVDARRIVEIQQPVPDHVVRLFADAQPHSQIAACGISVRLLFLAAYYPHKNHRILPAVARELRNRRMADRVHIFVNLEETQSASAALRRQLEEYPDVITNLKKLSWQEVAEAWKASTALFLPTLAESYGLVYLEAMACGLPILTSDRDFAHWMCQDLARYFDPHDAASMVDAILDLPHEEDLPDYRQSSQRRLGQLPQGWDEVAASFLAVLQQAALERPDGNR